MGKVNRLFLSILSAFMLISTIGIRTVPITAQEHDIIVDFNTSIGTASKHIFGAADVPKHNDVDGWNILKGTMGISVVKIKVDLAQLYPQETNLEYDSKVRDEYLHVAQESLLKQKHQILTLL